MRHFSQRVDRHGRPFGESPSEKLTVPSYKRRSPFAFREEGNKEALQNPQIRSPTDSHSYRRGDKLSPTGLDIIGSKEKAPNNEEELVNTPYTTPVQNPEHQDKEVQNLHDNIMMELQDATLKYLDIPEPIESEARRQRVLEGETHNLMAETAANMLANALKTKPLDSNHAFYAELEAEYPTPPPSPAAGTTLARLILVFNLYSC
ncbi:unnamed protein product [Eruca vesicaria subsp. sativa]|uniref:Uncharacterized protein n=1 Tax=Eruca vesicaria subsp. sativa TaxID=29727 RepID=A0ABC8L0H8_ERUVS|nr:unnamed protein product [Eruca vesicaria subsp. sativa]